jgi:hypothetical protein
MLRAVAMVHAVIRTLVPHAPSESPVQRSNVAVTAAPRHTSTACRSCPVPDASTDPSRSPRPPLLPPPAADWVVAALFGDIQPTVPRRHPSASNVQSRTTVLLHCAQLSPSPFASERVQRPRDALLLSFLSAEGHGVCWKLIPRNAEFHSRLSDKLPYGPGDVLVMSKAGVLGEANLHIWAKGSKVGGPIAPRWSGSSPGSFRGQVAGCRCRQQPSRSQLRHVAAEAPP